MIRNYWMLFLIVRHVCNYVEIMNFFIVQNIVLRDKCVAIIFTVPYLEHLQWPQVMCDPKIKVVIFYHSPILFLFCDMIALNGFIAI